MKSEEICDEPRDEAYYETLKISHKGRIAVVIRDKRGRHRVLVHGKLHKPYPFILSPDKLGAIKAASEALRKDPNALTPNYSNTIQFMPDQETVYYPAHNGKGFIIASEGYESRPYDFLVEGMPLFSEDGKKIVFAGIRNGKVYVVQNGRESDPYDDLQSHTFKFSPDSKKLAYCAKKGLKWKVFHEGGAFKAFEGIAYDHPVFSPNSKHVAYVAFTQMNRQTVQVDGRNFGEWDAVATESLKFSPDSKQITFAVRNKRSWYLFVDAKPYGPYEEILQRTAMYNKDGSRLVWAAKANGLWTIYENGKPVLIPPPPPEPIPSGKKSRRRRRTRKPKPQPLTGTGVLLGTPMFTPDGKKLLVGLRRDNNQWVLWNEDKFSEPFERIIPGTVAATSDSAKVLFIGLRGEDVFPVVNDKVIPDVYDVGSMRVSKGEGSSTYAMAIVRKRTPEEIREVRKKTPKDQTVRSYYWMVLVNGEDRFGPYMEIQPQALTVSRNGARIAYPALDKDGWGIFADGERRTDDLPLWIRFHPEKHRLEALAIVKKKYVFSREVLE